MSGCRPTAFGSFAHEVTKRQFKLLYLGFSYEDLFLIFIDASSTLATMASAWRLSLAAMPCISMGLLAIRV
jgi:hypothetical protein